MKKIIIALSLFVTLGTSAVFANEETKVNAKVMSSFRKEFKTADNISWTINNEYAKASFTYGEHRMESYYNLDGELLGTARGLLFNELPLAVTNEVNKKYGLAPVNEILEITKGGETFYYFTVELKNKNLQVRASNAGELTVEHRTGK